MLSPVEKMEVEATVTGKLGFHARPVTDVWEYLQTVPAVRVQLHCKGNSAPGDSTLQMMMLTAEQGDKIRVCVEGPGAASVAARVRELIERDVY